MRLGVNPSAAMVSRTSARVAALTRGWLLITRETVCWETPAARATSQIETVFGRAAVGGTEDSSEDGGVERACGDCTSAGGRDQPVFLIAALDSLFTLSAAACGESWPSQTWLNGSSTLTL